MMIQIECPTCYGNGHNPSIHLAAYDEECSKCDGKGYIYVEESSVEDDLS